MRHQRTKRVVALVFLIAAASLVAFGRADNDPPTEQEKEFAVQTADLLQAEIFAALLQEFGETTLSTNNKVVNRTASKSLFLRPRFSSLLN